MDPTVLFSDMGIACSNRRQRVLPQRRWLVSTSETVMDADSHGHSRMTCAALISPSAIWRLSSARARRTSFARANARRCCGAGAIVAAAFICPPCRPTSSWGGVLLVMCVLASGMPTGPASSSGQRTNLPRKARSPVPGPQPRCDVSDAGATVCEPPSGVQDVKGRKIRSERLFSSVQYLCIREQGSPTDRTPERTFERRPDVLSGVAGGAPPAVLAGARERAVLGLVRGLHGGEGLERALERRPVVRGHDARAQQCTARRHGRMQCDVDEHAGVV